MRKLSKCSWVKLPTWERTVGKEFLDDIKALCKTLVTKVGRMKLNVEQVQRVQSATAPVCTPSDEKLVDYYERPKAPQSTAVTYQPLSNALGELGDNFFYQPITVTDELMSIDPRSSLAVKTHARTKYLEKLRFHEAAIGIYVYDGGGPYPRHVQVWVIEQPVPQAKHAAAIAKANANLQQFATRQMKHEFISNFLPAGISPAVFNTRRMEFT